MRLPYAYGRYPLARIYQRLSLDSSARWRRSCGLSHGRWFRRSRRLWTCRRLRGRACHAIRNVGIVEEGRLTNRLRRILRCRASLVVRLLTC
jgi:hypothetical protein